MKPRRTLVACQYALVTASIVVATVFAAHSLAIVGMPVGRGNLGLLFFALAPLALLYAISARLKMSDTAVAEKVWQYFGGTLVMCAIVTWILFQVAAANLL